MGRSGDRAFLWHSGAMTDLGPGAAFNINRGGAIIGDSFLWHNGVHSPLTAQLPPHSGWTGLQGRDINDYGDIVGTGVHKGQVRTFILWP